MKKLLIAFVCLILLFSLSTTAFATEVSLSGLPENFSKDSTATVSVKINQSPLTTSAYIKIDLGENLELVSGEWKVDGFVKDFQVNSAEGVIAFSKAISLNGEIASFVIKGKNFSANDQKVAVKVMLKNQSNNIDEISVEDSIKISCNKHTFGNFIKLDEQNHQRSCSTCGVTEKTAHSFSSVTTKPASCKEYGINTLTCSVCKASKEQKIEKIENHIFGEWYIIKDATCTEPGLKERLCSVCKTREKETINILSHEIKEPTIIKEATDTEQGLKEGECEHCEEVTQVTIPPIKSEIEAEIPEKQNSNPFDIWLIVAIFALIIAITVVVVLIVKKKKSNTKLNNN